MWKFEQALGAVNKTMDPRKIGLTMAQFQRETEKMNMTEEMMNDTLADAFDTDEAEEVRSTLRPRPEKNRERTRSFFSYRLSAHVLPRLRAQEAEDVVGSVLAEIGIDITKGLQDAPTAAPIQQAALPEAAPADVHLRDLQAQLGAL